MIQKRSEVEVLPEEPFDNDELDREKFADTLTTLIKTSNGPLVIGLSGKWGTGKTTFVRMWQEKLEPEFKCLYFNAWKNDFVSDPLVAFVGEISKVIQANGDESEIDREAKIKQLQNAAGKVIKFGIPPLLRILSAGLVDAEAMRTAIEEVAAGTEQIFEEYEEEQKSIKEFRTELKSFAQSFQSPSNDSGSTPLIFFVDELDRCRPDFAVELLERVKHLFNVPNVVFILSTAKDQLRHSLRAFYGEGMDAEAYLRRFIDLEYSLPEPSPEKYVNVLFNAFEFKDLLKRYQNQSQVALLELIARMTEVMGLSLRDQDQYFTRLSLIYRIQNERASRTDEILLIFTAFVTALRMFKNDLYSDIRANGSRLQDVLQIAYEFERDKLTWQSPGLSFQLRAVLISAIRLSYCGSRADEVKEADSLRQRFEGERDNAYELSEHHNPDSPSEREELEEIENQRDLSDTVLRLFEDLQSNYGHDFDREIFEVVELTSGFK